MQTGLETNVAVLSAAQNQQPAFELPEVKHGAFTFYFLDAITRLRYSNTSKIGPYVVNEVSKATNGRQTPVIEGDLQLPLNDDGQFEDPTSIFGLVIGLSEYEDRSFRPPSFAVRDAVAVYNWLVGAGVPPENILLSLNAEASKGELSRQFADLSAKVERGSTAFVYYSGLGAVEENPAGDEADGLDEYLMAFDSLAGNLSETAIIDDWFTAMLGTLSAKGGDAVVVLDTSYAVPRPK